MGKKAFLFSAQATWYSLQKECKLVTDTSGRIQDHYKLCVI